MRTHYHRQPRREYSAPVSYPDPGSLAEAQRIPYPEAFRRWWNEVQREAAIERKMRGQDGDE